jgi:hypothetical protein
MELELAAYGWEGAAWDALYPEDLPPEWRLDYYGNDYGAIVVPAASWQQATIDEANRWLTEAPDGFRFYWELGDAEGAARLLELLAGQAAFPGRVAGWLLHAGASLEHALVAELSRALPGAAYGEAPLATVQAEQLAAEGVTLCWQDGDQLNCRGHRLRVMQISRPPALRALRRLIDAQNEAGTERLLLLLKPEALTPSVMQELQTLIALLNG